MNILDNEQFMGTMTLVSRSADSDEFKKILKKKVRLRSRSSSIGKCQTQRSLRSANERKKKVTATYERSKASGGPTITVNKYDPKYKIYSSARSLVSKIIKSSEK